MTEKFTLCIFCVITSFLFGQEIRDAELALDDSKFLNRASTLPFTLDFQYSTMVVAGSTNDNVKNYLKENSKALDFNGQAFSFRYAIVNSPIFNFQLGGLIGYNNFLLIDYYKTVEVDSSTVTLKDPIDEQFQFLRYGISYKVNWVLYKSLKYSHGPFIQGDLTLKSNLPGQYTDNLEVRTDQMNIYYDEKNNGAQLSEKLENGRSWNQISFGYQISRKMGTYVDAQLKLSYGLLFGSKHPFTGSQIATATLGFSFGKRQEAKYVFRKNQEEYQYEKNRPKYD